MVKNLDLGKVLFGVALLLVAWWAFSNLTDETTKYLGTAIAGLLGLLSLYSGMMRK
jgi:hypothetical protein